MPKILVIDDEELLIKTFVKLLEREGHEVFVAKRGDDALEMAEEDSYDLIICDIRMPGIDGIETVRRLREICNKRNISNPPEIIITGYADQGAEARVAALGPVAYMWKPFDSEELLTRIRGILK